MSLFEWVPTRTEKLSVVRTILARVAHEDVSEIIVDAYPNHPIAFFADVAGAAVEEMIRRHPLSRERDMRIVLTKRARGQLSAAVLQGRLLGSGDLLELAEKTATGRQGALRSFIKEPSL
jgi:hypothetical protein